MKILATVSLLSLLAAPAMAAETDAKPDAKADSSASMKHDGMMMMGDHDKMGGSMMMSADHAKMMSAKHKKVSPLIEVPLLPLPYRKLPWMWQVRLSRWAAGLSVRSPASPQKP